MHFSNKRSKPIIASIRKISLIGLPSIICFFLLSFALRLVEERKISSTPHLESARIQDYIGKVNHIRQNDAPMRRFKINPKNRDSDSIYLYSIYGDAGKPYTLFQGDSWMEEIELSMDANSFSSSQVEVFGGITSYSPSLYAAQLAYLAKELGPPSRIVVFIDQTDIGDEYYRYRSVTDYTCDVICEMRVKPFGPGEHKLYYNYNYIPYSFSVINLLDNTLGVLNRSIFKYLPFLIAVQTRGFINLTSTYTISDILQPLSEETGKHASHNYFLQQLDRYVKIARQLNVKSIVLVTHPHKNHLVNYDNANRYKTSTSDLVDLYLDRRKSSADASAIKVYHLASKICNGSDCQDSFIPNDASSHLTQKSYMKLKEEIDVFLREVVRQEHDQY
jgi:hypothetical protein